VAWIERIPDGSAALRVDVFDAEGAPLGAVLEVATQAEPTDPHLLPAGQPGSVLLAWLDRPIGSKLRRVYVAGLVLE
jgi:hypothetical protein